MDGTLAKNLDLLKQQVANKYDGIFCISGNEGTGKTIYSHSIAYFLDQEFNLQNIVFSGQELVDRIQKCKRGNCIVYDEAITSLSTSDAATEMQTTIIKLFTVIRSKGLYIILILPNVFMLRRYFFIFRTKFLLHTYSTNGIDRGYFKFYSYKRKKIMYLEGQKQWNMNVVTPNFKGRFTNTEGFFIDPVAYEEKKQNAIKSLTEDKKSKELMLKEQYEDSKLKLKIQVEQWKQRYQEKTELKFAKYKQQLQDIKTKYTGKIDEIKSGSLLTEKNRAIQKANEYEKEISKVLYFFYKYESDRYYKLTGKEYDIGTFSKFVGDIIPQIKLKSFIKAGEEYNKLSHI